MTEEDALTKFKQFIQAKKSKAKRPKYKAMWDFRSSPHEQFHKTLDDTFLCFIKWAKLKTRGQEDTYNVSKALRRIEAYAEWMEENAGDLVEPPLTPASVKEALDACQLKVSIDKDENFVWWFDLNAMDREKIKNEIKIEDSLRSFVWYAHYIMFHPNAQDGGMTIVENVAKVGFFESFSMVPMSLSAKLNGLTIGVLPVKLKKLYLLEAPGWMRTFMRIVSVFLSKKMKSRIVILDDWSKVAEELGEDCIPKGFGKLEGSLQVDAVEQEYFSN